MRLRVLLYLLDLASAFAVGVVWACVAGALMWLASGHWPVVRQVIGLVLGVWAIVALVLLRPRHRRV